MSTFFSYHQMEEKQFYHVVLLLCVLITELHCVYNFWGLLQILEKSGKSWNFKQKFLRP